MTTTLTSELKDIYLFSGEATTASNKGIKIEFPFFIKGDANIYYFLTISLFNNAGSAQTLAVTCWGTGAEVSLATSALTVANGAGFFIRLLFQQINGNTTNLNVIGIQYSTNGKTNWTSMTLSGNQITKRSITITNTVLNLGFKLANGVAGLRGTFYILTLGKIIN